MPTTAGFRALIRRSFELTGRGTVVSVDILESVVTIGDQLTVPMRDGTSRIVEVRGVDFLDIDRQAAKAEIGLTFEDVAPDEVSIGSVVMRSVVTAAST